jgi:hypothetical protein
MPKYKNGKLLNIITYEDDTPISEQIEFLEACTKYDIVDFTNLLYNYPIDCLPSNIKFINISLCIDFNQLLNNLPINLLGLSLPGKYDKPLDYLPYGLKYLYFASRESKQLANILIEPPPNLKYLCAGRWCYNMKDELKCIYDSFSGASPYSHKLFLEDTK